MKTLVIHPADDSTTFLDIIYKDKGWTVINDSYTTRKEYVRQIKEHDRIIMMGHGCPSGLFYTPIDSKMVYLLREKECVCIWCNADKFVQKYNLKGFYTGMFISEVSEANYFGIKIDQADVTYSNLFFVNLMSGFIDSENILNEIKSSYLDDDNPVIQFNTERLYYREADMSELVDDLLHDHYMDMVDDFLNEDNKPLIF
jgi:hypothetical protein